jgi:hypothetical protein
VRRHFQYNIRPNSRRLADLKNRTAELERKLSDARVSLERELAQSARGRRAASAQFQDIYRTVLEDMGRDYDDDGMSAGFAAPNSARGRSGANSRGRAYSPEGRTEVLVNHGRRSAYYSRLSRGRKVSIGTAVIAAGAAILVMTLSGGGASWPASVATVQAEADQACQNPDVKSEPGQVNFACAKTTRQILWVFALMTSTNNPNFADPKTGRMGLEPIMAAQGGEMAWSLNLHHPYSPTNPVDSLQVAARSINNIIGGATLTGANGSPVVQPGLESASANCLRYTGSAAVNARTGFPSICAKPVTSPQGQAALVADVYRKWMVGAAPKAAQDAAVLFANATNPGDPQVQAILNHLPHSKPLA